MRATPPTGLPVLRPLSSFMHASANTPAGAASASIALFPAATGLPLFRAGSTPTLPVSGPARRSLTFRPACSLNRLSRSFCQSASIHVVTSMNRPDCYQPETIVAGRDSHPLERGAFHGARGSRATNATGYDGRAKLQTPWLCYLSETPAPARPRRQYPCGHLSSRSRATPAPSNERLRRKPSRARRRDSQVMNALRVRRSSRKSPPGTFQRASPAMNINERRSEIRLSAQPRPVPSMSLVNSITALSIMARGSKLGSDMTPQILRRCMPMLPAS